MDFFVRLKSCLPVGQFVRSLFFATLSILWFFPSLRILVSRFRRVSDEICASIRQVLEAIRRICLWSNPPRSRNRSRSAGKGLRRIRLDNPAKSHAGSDSRRFSNNNNNKHVYFLQMKQQSQSRIQRNGREDPSKPTDPRQHMNTVAKPVWDGSFLEAPLRLITNNSNKITRRNVRVRSNLSKTDR